MEARRGRLERQMKNKTASSRNKIHEENCWSHTLGPQKIIKKFLKI
jgi:hypothetical protein